MDPSLLNVRTLAHGMEHYWPGVNLTAKKLADLVSGTRDEVQELTLKTRRERDPAFAHLPSPQLLGSGLHVLKHYPRQVVT